MAKTFKQLESQQTQRDFYLLAVQYLHYLFEKFPLVLRCGKYFDSVSLGSCKQNEKMNICIR